MTTERELEEARPTTSGLIANLLADPKCVHEMEHLRISCGVALGPNDDSAHIAYFASLVPFSTDLLRARITGTGDTLREALMALLSKQREENEKDPPPRDEALVERMSKAYWSGPAPDRAPMNAVLALLVSEGWKRP